MMSRAYWQRWKPVAVMLGDALMCVACTAKPVATPATPTAVEPPVKSQMSAPPVSSQPLTSAPEKPVALSAPPPQVTPTRDTARAQALLEQGRRHQQTHGQDGANEAIALYEAALSADPQCAACYWERSWSKQLQGDWNGCIEDWDRVRALDPDFPELDHHYPVALMRRDQAQSLSALPTLDRLLPPELEPRPGPTLSVNAVGDINMGRAWPRHLAKLPPNGARDFFTHVTDPLRRADITFGNLETVLQDEGDSSKCQPTSTKCFAFRVPTAYSAVLRDAGFDVLSLANNHTGDFGEAGRRDTMAALDRVGIYHSGPVGDIATWEIRGLRVALIAFATGGGVYRLHHLETAQRLIADVDRQHDLVFVSFHGGAGHRRVPRPAWRRVCLWRKSWRCSCVQPCRHRRGGRSGLGAWPSCPTRYGTVPGAAHRLFLG